MSQRTPEIVILGGGFGGLYAAKALRRASANVTIVDRKNHHLFQPLLYQVATASVNPSDIAAPIRAILGRHRNTRVLLAEVTSIDVEARKVRVSDGDPIDYDELIIATGATHSYFGHDEWARHAPGLKTIEDALEMRRRILMAYEAAEREPDPQLRQSWMTFVVVGAGPTGVELAGALAEIAHRSLPRDFRRIDTRSARIILVEGLPRVLSSYPEELSERARQQLEQLGVEVQTNRRVSAIDSSGVTMGTDRIESRTVLWAAGVKASPLLASLGAPLDKAGRVLVEPDLSVPGHPEVMVIGDAAAVKHDESWVPGVAPAAIQEGQYAAQRLIARLQGKDVGPFRYRDKGSLATIGRASGVADFGKLRFSGYPAWLAWLFIHILYLIGFRNRILVMIQWAWAYLTWQRGARLITDTSKSPEARG